jgi:alkaline phosphatase D
VSGVTCIWGSQAIDPHNVILWTRRRCLSAALTVEVAEDTSMVKPRWEHGLEHRGWTARVLIGGLMPARTYWYRFTDTDRNGGGRPSCSAAVCAR